jgi:hypothetical protein
MNRNGDFETTLAVWLRRQAPPQAPDRVLDAALERVGSESQRRGLLQRLSGGIHMTAIIRATAVTAVVAVALLVGIQLGNLSPNTSQGSPTATPEATPSPTATPTASPEPSASLPTGCVNPPEDVSDLMEAQHADGADPATCYGSTPITVDARWTGPGVADCPSAPEPTWLACSPFSLQVVGETRKVGAPFLDVALDPSIGSFPTASVDVRVTGHFDDPAASTCRNTFALPDASPESDEVVVERCRQMFVITQIEELAS